MAYAHFSFGRFPVLGIGWGAFSQSCRGDLFRPTWPKGLTYAFWFWGHMKVKNPFLTKIWWSEQLLTDSSDHQICVRNGFLTSMWPQNQNAWVKPFGQVGRNTSPLRLGLHTESRYLKTPLNILKSFSTWVVLIQLYLFSSFTWWVQKKYSDTTQAEYYFNSLWAQELDRLDTYSDIWKSVLGSSIEGTH